MTSRQTARIARIARYQARNIRFLALRRTLIDGSDRIEPAFLKDMPLFRRLSGGMESVAVCEFNTLAAASRGQGYSLRFERTGK